MVHSGDLWGNSNAWNWRALIAAGCATARPHEIEDQRTQQYGLERNQHVQPERVETTVPLRTEQKKRPCKQGLCRKRNS